MPNPSRRFFSKITKQMSRKIQVKTKDEIVICIYKYFDEINETPMAYYWTWDLDNIDTSESVVTEIFSKNVSIQISILKVTIAVCYIYVVIQMSKKFLVKNNPVYMNFMVSVSYHT